MKKVTLKKSFWQSVLSTIALVIFAYFAIASISGIPQITKKYIDGRLEVTQDHLTMTTVMTGNVDSNGMYHGPVTVVYQSKKDSKRRFTEVYNYVHGRRNGMAMTTDMNGKVTNTCYRNGVRVETVECQKKFALTGSEDNSAFGIFSYKSPWFAFKLDAFGFDDSYMKAYMDTLESILYSTEFDLEEFDDYYDEALDVLGETAYDSINQMNASLSIVNGMDLILSHEFRLATIHSYGKSDGNTYNVVKMIYPYYLLSLNALGVTDTDFEVFCSEYDQIISSYDPVDRDDPFFVDSMDQRMYIALDSIYSGEEALATKSQSLKSAVLSYKDITVRSLEREFLSRISSQSLNMTPKEVSEIVLFGILEMFFDGDLIRPAVREAFTIKKGIAVLPTVITDFSGNTSSTSAVLNGYVIEDGGGEVASRGMAWGTVYNPTIDNQEILAGTGTGEFSTNLSGLTEGLTYYARAFATNSAGTAYGNCISFIAQNTTGIDPSDFSTLDYSIYPNPASDHITLTIKTQDSKAMVFTLCDLNGKVIIQKELASLVQGDNLIRINMSEIANGSYICSLKGDENTNATQILLINR